MILVIINHSKELRALLSKLFLLKPLDESHEAFRLIFEACEEFFVRDAAVVREQAIDAWKENAVGVDKAVAIAKDLLELFDGTQSTPDARGQPNEADGTMFEALGELEHVDEILQDSRHTAVVLGRDNHEPRGLQH